MGLEKILTLKGNSQLTNITNKQWCEFLFSSQISPWTTNAISSGTASSGNATQKHPGIVQYSSSTTANSGYGLRFSNSAVMLGGGEKTTFVFKTATTLSGITRRMGFHNTLDSTDAIDGVYAEIIDGVIKGKTANNSTRSLTGTTYTLSADTWYRLKIELNFDASKATFMLYADDSNTPLWQDVLTANIPTARTTGHSDVCTSSGTTAITIGTIDYVDVILPNARRVN